MPDDIETSTSPTPEQYAQLERDNAFLRAGVDTTTPLGGLVARGYDGPLEADKIKEFVAGVQASMGTGPAAPPTPELSEVERQATAQRETLANGASGETKPPPADPIKEGMTLAQEGLKHGMTEEEAIGGFVNHIASAHMNGVAGLTVAERAREREGRVARI